MTKLRRICSKIWHFHAGDRLVQLVSFIFIILFAAAMGFDAIRTDPALSILGGAITTNTSVIVVLLYFLVGSAFRFFRFQFVWSKNRFSILTSKQVEPTKPRVLDEDSPASAEVEVVRDDDP